MIDAYQRETEEDVLLVRLLFALGIKKPVKVEIEPPEPFFGIEAKDLRDLSIIHKGTERVFSRALKEIPKEVLETFPEKFLKGLIHSFFISYIRFHAAFNTLSKLDSMLVKPVKDPYYFTRKEPPYYPYGPGPKYAPDFFEESNAFVEEIFKENFIDENFLYRYYTGEIIAALDSRLQSVERDIFNLLEDFFIGYFNVCIKETLSYLKVKYSKRNEDSFWDSWSVESYFTQETVNRVFEVIEKYDVSFEEAMKGEK